MADALQFARANGINAMRRERLLDLIATPCQDGDVLRGEATGLVVAASDGSSRAVRLSFHFRCTRFT